MLKLMIVDDEYYFREALKISMPWSALGIEVCGEAKNGREAIEKADLLRPDIILVDINMPIMDGLEFVQTIREAGHSSRIIILTGHSEFSYAKQAVQLGVHTYILKPVNEEELRKALLDIRRVIEKETSLRIETDRLRQQVRDSLPQLRDKFLNELIQGRLLKKDSQTLKKMEFLNIHNASLFFKAVTIELDLEDKLPLTDEDKQLYLFAVTNMADEILSEAFTFVRCCDSEDRICIIMESGSLSDDEEYNTSLECKLEYLRDTIQRYMGFTVTIGVGNGKSELFEVSASYKESLVALKNKITIGRNRVIPYSSLTDTELKTSLFTIEHRSQLLMAMRLANDGEVRQLIARIFERIRRENIPYDVLFVACVDMISACLEYIVEVGGSFREIFQNNQASMIDQIQHKKSINEMEEHIASLFQHTLDAVKRNKNSKASRMIEEVKKYIRNNYQHDELSIEEIARNLFVNYAHLCFVFKRDTGSTINEYLTEFRIKKAKQLMDSGNTLILDVAARVGYADANYFGKCFKKFYGLAPSKYVESIRH